MVLRSSNIQNSELDFEDNVYVSDNVVPSKISTKANDVLMCVRNGSKALVGKTAIIDSNHENLAWGAFMTVLRPREKNSLLYHFLNSQAFKRQIFADLDTATVKQITLGTLNSIKIALPTLSEQNKLSLFLDKLDLLIKKHKHLVACLKSYKRGAILHYFTTQMRSAKWTKTTISKCLFYEQPQKYIVHSEHYSNAYATPVLTANKAFILGYTNETDGIYNKGEVLIYDDFTMEIKYVNFPFKVKSSTIKMLTPRSNIDLYFMFNLLQYLGLKPEGHQRSYISILEPLEIDIPIYEEQIQAAKLFRLLDNKIAKEQEVLQKTTQLKLALLQRLFI